jgi:hypothetical protein
MTLSIAKERKKKERKYDGLDRFRGVRHTCIAVGGGFRINVERRVK